MASKRNQTSVLAVGWYDISICVACIKAIEAFLIQTVEFLADPTFRKTSHLPCRCKVQPLLLFSDLTAELRVHCACSGSYASPETGTKLFEHPSLRDSMTESRLAHMRRIEDVSVVPVSNA